MRGKGTEEIVVVQITGITPAYAGKSFLQKPLTKRTGDHPRVCGEKFRKAPRISTGRGSPPRMRGKVLLPYSPAWKYRITPAYAGKSHRRSFRHARRWDHPRVCGEKYLPWCRRSGSRGSPPRMRGKVPCPVFGRLSRGITPAYAGKSGFHTYCAGLVRDHPRVCGEKITGNKLTLVRYGSPPRMRGKGTHLDIFFFGHGITPAYAGKSYLQYNVSSDTRDHPRVCGEKSMVAPSSGPCTGSPPRMRGKDDF